MDRNYDSVLKSFGELDSKNSKWKEVIDEHFWPIDKWPKHLVLNLYNCKYPDRISIISFLYKNAFPPNFAFDLIQFYAKPSENGTKWNVRERELRSVWDKCKQVTLNGNRVDQEKYFYYSMVDKTVYNYAGQKKKYGRIVEPKPDYIASRKIEHKQPPLDYRKLLDEDEEFEAMADQIASNCEREYEKRILDEILDDIRNG